MPDFSVYVLVVQRRERKCYYNEKDKTHEFLKSFKKKCDVPVRCVLHNTADK